MRCVLINLILLLATQDEETSDCPLLTPSPPTRLINNPLNMFHPLENNLEMTTNPTMENINTDDGLNAFMNILNSSSKPLQDGKFLITYLFIFTFYKINCSQYSMFLQNQLQETQWWNQPAAAVAAAAAITMSRFALSYSRNSTQHINIWLRTPKLW